MSVVNNIFVISDTSNHFNNNVIQSNIEYVNRIIAEFQKKGKSCQNAIDFLKSCNPYLNNIQQELGQTNIIFLNVSTVVAVRALEMIMFEINSSVKRRNDYLENLKLKKNSFLVQEYKQRELNKVLWRSWKAFLEVEKIPKHYSEKMKFEKNKREFKKFYREADRFTIFIKDRQIKLWVVVVVCVVFLELLLDITIGEVMYGAVIGTSSMLLLVAFIHSLNLK